MGKIMFHNVNYSGPTVSATGVTGVKGAQEDTFHTGQVTLTPEHIGAMPYSYVFGCNFNDMTSPGFYSIGQETSNGPSELGNNGLLVLSSNYGNLVWQISFSKDDMSLCYRKMENNQWSSWKEIYMAGRTVEKASSATRATQDGSGNIITNTYLEKEWKYLGVVHMGGERLFTTVRDCSEFMFIVSGHLNSSSNSYSSSFDIYKSYTVPLAVFNSNADAGVTIDFDEEESMMATKTDEQLKISNYGRTKYIHVYKR